jgi:uncharacterized protein YxeA
VSKSVVIECIAICSVLLYDLQINRRKYYYVQEEEEEEEQQEQQQQQQQSFLES